MLIQHSVTEKKIIISQTQTVKTCESDVIDKVEEFAIAEKEDNEEKVTVRDKYQPTGELEQPIPLLPFYSNTV